MVEHFCVTFGDFSYIGFLDIMQKDRQTNAGENHTLVTAIGVCVCV